MNRLFFIIAFFMTTVAGPQSLSPASPAPAAADAASATADVASAAADAAPAAAVEACEASKSAACCSEDRPVTPGDCEDVIVNDDEKSCAFVEDIMKCSNLPDGWFRAFPEGDVGRVCPTGYEWLDEYIECVTAPDCE